ncbi:MAG: hypothetical protein QG594_2484, partial [Bacteroidota bacterium]|nr:hypothetical protein [Bacteroidota bacterium]
LRMLDKLGCPLTREQRQEGDHLVILGGWSVSRNPLPLFDFADVIGIGDSEHLVKLISETYRDNRQERERLFNLLSQQEGIILPSRYAVSTENGYLTQWEAKDAPTDIKKSKSTAFPHSLYLSPETDYNDIGYYDGKTFFSMEIVDACASKCHFCASGYKEKHRDIQDPQAIVELAKIGAEHGADLAKLFFPANSSVAATKEIMKGLMANGMSPRVGSAKAERIDHEYIELIGKSGQEKIAFAPETGDYELRKHLGKPGMTQEVLENVIIASVDAGIPNLDFYLIMNLPGEAQDSFDRSIDMLSGFYDLAKSKGLEGRVRMSAPNFFPKAGTTFQYAPSGEIDEYITKMDLLNYELDGKVKVSSMKGSVDLLSQNIMSRGGNEVGALMYEVYTKLKEQEAATGIFTPDTVEDWRSAMADLGLNERAYFDAKDPNRQLPWEHIHLHDIPLASLKKGWDVFKKKRSIFILD